MPKVKALQCALALEIRSVSTGRSLGPRRLRVSEPLEVTRHAASVHLREL